MVQVTLLIHIIKVIMIVIFIITITITTTTKEETIKLTIIILLFPDDSFNNLRNREYIGNVFE